VICFLLYGISYCMGGGKGTEGSGVMLYWYQYLRKVISHSVIGISLLDTINELFGKVFQRRLQELAEGLCLIVCRFDIQCSLVVGKTIEYQNELFMFFVDLRNTAEGIRAV